VEQKNYKLAESFISLCLQRRHMMKKLLILTLAFILTGCGALAPVPPTPAPTTTPIIEIATVLVTVIPTQEPTQVPSDTPIPSPTATVPAAATPTTAAASSPTLGAAPAASGETPTLPANAGGDLFTNLTRSGNILYLKCLPSDITFGVSTSSVATTEVDFYYRMEDRLSVSISTWKNGGAMKSDKNGNFTVDFQAATVSADLRSHRAWLDYQFVGLNKVGDATGRSLRIVQQITYKIECTD
jgi:hypothetical protein